MTRLGAYARGQRVKEISRLEHKLTETSNSLKSTLEAVLAFESKMAKVAVDLELAEARATEMERREREKTVEVVEMKKALRNQRPRSRCWRSRRHR